MTKPLRLDVEAAEELDDAGRWYEARRANLGIEFLLAVRDAFARIEADPQAWPLARQVPARLQSRVRSCLLRRFPYAVVYVELDHEIRVLALAHGSREPGYWRHRL
ncbi:MAG TPA: type II toxin-antitoxin system RelE/ParE family toxin [Kofleriaceae bacterium]|jgi:plasmid stabilization system protein ParE|nr:type II toxin-antitoxin system RelE/ParE family toxin [Kofleriaceae bacterium]